MQLISDRAFVAQAHHALMDAIAEGRSRDARQLAGNMADSDRIRDYLCQVSAPAAPPLPAPPPRQEREREGLVQ